MARKKKKSFIERNEFLTENKGIIVTLIAIVTIVAIALIYYRVSTNFEYNGVSFIKRYDGSILLYTAKIPTKDYFGNTNEYLLFDFRNDPRKLGNINFNYNGTIKFIDDKMTYVSYPDGEMKSCEDNSLAGAYLGLFLNRIGITYKAGLDNSSYLNSTTTPYVNCNVAPFNTVIQIRGGDETKISKTMLSCYNIQFKDCDILKAVEAFELKILEQYAQSLTS